jgi:putative transposase
MIYEYKPFYRRKLPHFHSPGSTLFITFRLADSIPKEVARRWADERSQLRGINRNDKAHKEFNRRWFREFEDVLHKAATGPTWLADPRVAEIVADSLKYRDGRDYDLIAYCIMSNHAHTVFTPLLNGLSITEVIDGDERRFLSDRPPAPVIMKSLKGYTAYKANRLLNRTGAFWEEESYDHEVDTPADLGRIVNYVLDNPVKAGLVDHWSEWKWSYYRE